MKQHLLESEEAAENGVDNYPHFPPFRQLEENEEPLHDFPQEDDQSKLPRRAAQREEEGGSDGWQRQSRRRHAITAAVVTSLLSASDESHGRSD